MESEVVRRLSQTTYPPLPQQWIALLSYVMGLNLGYMLVQMVGILLLAVGTYRYARLWVDEGPRAMPPWAVFFLARSRFWCTRRGSFDHGAAPLYLNALPYFYEWSRRSKWRSLIKGLALTLAGAAAHHVTLLFGAVLFAIPVLWLAVMDRMKMGGASAATVVSRATVFAAIAAIGVAAVLLPYFVALWHNPITQVPIPMPAGLTIYSIRNGA